MIFTNIIKIKMKYKLLKDLPWINKGTIIVLDELNRPLELWKEYFWVFENIFNNDPTEWLEKIK